MAPLTGGSGEEGTGWLQEKINWPKEHYPQGYFEVSRANFKLIHAFYSRFVFGTVLCQNCCHGYQLIDHLQFVLDVVSLSFFPQHNHRQSLCLFLNSHK